jgi:hypothetical protein
MGRIFNEHYKILSDSRDPFSLYSKKLINSYNWNNYQTLNQWYLLQILIVLVAAYLNLDKRTFNELNFLNFKLKIFLKPILI